MNGYDLSRKWFDFAFENKAAKVQHTALFMWIIELANRLGWKEEFGLPTGDTMEGLSIGNKQTYYTTLNDLVSWGFVTVVQKSVNRYQSTYIRINKINEGDESKTSLDIAVLIRTATDTAITTATDTAIGDATAPIIKPINNETNKPIKLPSAKKAINHLEELLPEFAFPESVQSNLKILVNEKKWRGKSEAAIRGSLQSLAGFPDEEFCNALIKRAIDGGYQGLVFANTKDDFIKYQQKNDRISNSIINPTDKLGRNTTAEVQNFINFGRSADTVVAD